MSELNKQLVNIVNLCLVQLAKNDNDSNLEHKCEQWHVLGRPDGKMRIMQVFYEDYTCTKKVSQEDLFEFDYCNIGIASYFIGVWDELITKYPILNKSQS